MSTNNLSTYARRIVSQSLKAKQSNSDYLDPNETVRAVVNDLYDEVGPNRWDGTVNSALIEIVQSYVNSLAISSGHSSDGAA